MAEERKTWWLVSVYNRTLRPWVEWFSRYPLLLVVAAAVVWFSQEVDPNSPGLGVQYLFWHDDWLVQLFAGSALAVLIGEVCFVGYLLDADEKWMFDENESVIKRRRWQYMGWTYLPIMSFIVWHALRDFEQRKYVLFGALIGTLLNLVVGWVLHALITKQRAEALRDWVKRRNPWLNYILKLPDNGDLARLHLEAGAVFTLLTFLYVIYVVLPYDAYAALPFVLSPAVAICLLLGSIVATYGRLVFSFGPRAFGVFLIGAIGVVFFTGLPDYSHRFDGLDREGFSYYDKDNLVKLADVEPKSLMRPSAAFDGDESLSLVDDFAALKMWRDKQASGEQKPKIVIVCTSGGGLRAAVWTVVVMTELEREIPGFPHNVRIVTGASGGMLGVSYYVATIQQPGKEDTSASGSGGASNDPRVDKIAIESLSPTTRQLIIRDVPYLGWNLFDRGWAIERAWQDNTDGVLAKSLHTLAAGEREGWRPSLIVSPMLVEDGRLMLISNLDLRHLIKQRGAKLTKDGPTDDGEYSLSAVEFYRLFPKARGHFPLSTAARMSASFPYVTPASVLPTIPPRRVVDAGYYDNYGVDVAAAWLNHLYRTQREWLERNTSGVVMIQIRDSLTEASRLALTSPNEPGPSVWGQGLNWLDTPLDAVLSARQSTMSFRNDEMVQALSRLLNEENKPPFFTSIAFELSQNVSLNWYLTDDEIQRVKDDIRSDRNQRLIEVLRAWLARKESGP